MKCRIQEERQEEAVPHVFTALSSAALQGAVSTLQDGAMAFGWMAELWCLAGQVWDLLATQKQPMHPEPADDQHDEGYGEAEEEPCAKVDHICSWILAGGRHQISKLERKGFRHGWYLEVIGKCSLRRHTARLRRDNEGSMVGHYLELVY